MNTRSKFRLLLPLAALLMLLAAWFGLQQFALLPGEDALVSKHKIPAAYRGPVNAVAVLPFQDASLQQDQGWMAQGLARELILRLSANPAVQVTAPVSAFFFADGEGNPDVIAQRLQVTWLLRGDTEWREDAVVVNASLYNARRKSIAWQDTLERSTQQAPELVSDLLSRVLPSMGQQAVPVVDAWSGYATAWQHYLRGRYLLGPPAMGEAAEAEALIRSALELQPGAAVAWEVLAEAFLAKSPPELENAEAALFRSFEADPDSPDALGLLSYMQRFYAWDWSAAVESARLAVNARPGDARLLSLASRALFSAGRFEEARQHMLDSIERDPLNLASRLSLGLAQEFTGDLDEALTTYRLLIGLNPDFPAAHAFRARIKVLQDNPQSALRESESEPDPFWKDYAHALALLADDKREDAGVMLEQIAKEHGDSAAFQLAELTAYSGDVDASFEWLARAWAQKDGGLAGLTGNRLLQNLYADPRWQLLLQELGLTLDGDESSD